MRIGLAVVAKDEETQIVGMLQSAVGVVDAVYYLDNASTDRTRRLVECWAIKNGVPLQIQDEPEVRGYASWLYNRVLEAAAADGCDYLLLLDADERLTGHARQNLRGLMKHPSFDAWELSRRTVIAPYCRNAGGESAPYSDSIEVHEHHFRFFKTGAVSYVLSNCPEGLHPAHVPPTVSGRTGSVPMVPVWFTQDRDGWDQLRRDRARGQYNAADLVPLWQTCGGWFDFSAVYDLAVAEARPGGILAELGNYMGRSLLYLGQKAQDSGKDLKIVGVDMFRQETVSYHHEAILETGGRWLQLTAANVHRAGLADTVNLLQWKSDEAARLFDEQSMDFCFVDAAHDYDSVKRDIDAWWPRIVNGGILAGHDYSSAFPEVMQAVDEFAANLSLKLDLETSQCSWLVRKP